MPTLIQNESLMMLTDKWQAVSENGDAVDNANSNFNAFDNANSNLNSNSDSKWITDDANR